MMGLLVFNSILFLFWSPLFATVLMAFSVAFNIAWPTLALSMLLVQMKCCYNNTR